MDKQKVLKLFKLFFLPALLIGLGVVLVVNPDSAIALVTKIIAWVLVGVGVVSVLAILIDKTYDQVGKWVVPVICLAVGGYFLAHPLVLANIAARVIGIVMIVGGIGDLKESHYRAGKGLAIVMIVAGAVFVLMPSTLTHAILALVGLVMAIIGIVELLEKLREVKQLEAGEKPTIIDADE